MMDNGKLETAKKWFNENINFYHPLAIASLKKLLGITKEAPLAEPTFIQ
jgi:hypothetical protein